jgi:hypothetical protein
MAVPGSDLAAVSLSERSVNLDAALQRTLKPADRRESLCVG